MYNAQCDALTPKSVAEIVKELEKNEKVRLQLEFNKTGENSLTFTKDQTEEEIDEIHTDYRNKHRSEFQFLVDQVNKRWKKSGLRKMESAGNKEEVAVTELPAGAAPALEAEAPGGSGSERGSSERPRSVSPALSLSSGSTSSSSSDILRDLQEPETCSASSGRGSSVGLGANQRKPRRPRVLGSERLRPRGKRGEGGGGEKLRGTLESVPLETRAGTDRGPCDIEPDAQKQVNNGGFAHPGGGAVAASAMKTGTCIQNHLDKLVNWLNINHPKLNEEKDK
ncbi:RAD18 E3 ubiquitin protein ligase [Columba livia]|uniref:RAD18 E3 ubiquitin protein ligase n=1 Tax=Columba livia TaxID=8932 RepID=A0A2I0LUC9_COLLI|nr:RAD18 E3 ubiquitin protein ligase [Columba livia]